MDTKWLNEFLVVAKHGKLAPAARELFMSHSTLSDHIQMLEHELGAPLFERGNGGFTLTEFGENNLERAQRILMECDAMRAPFSDGTASVTHIRFPNYAFGLEPLLAVREAFQAGHPGRRVVFKTNELQMADPFDAIAEGLSDVACLYTVEDSGQDPAAMIPPEFDRVCVGTLDFVFLTTVRHPLAGKQVLSMADFEGQTLIASLCTLSDITLNGIKDRMAREGVRVNTMFRKLNRHDDLFATDLDPFIVPRSIGVQNARNIFGEDFVVHTSDFPIRLAVNLIWDPARLDDVQRAYLAELKNAALSGKSLL